MKKDTGKEIQKKQIVKMYGSVTVGSKGQIVIPKEVRDVLGINTGDTLLVMTKHEKAIGMIKPDDMDELLKYMKREVDSCKNIKN